VSQSAQLRDSRVPETVVIRLDHEAGPEDARAFVGRIGSIFPHLNWRTHFFIASEGSPQELECVRQINHALALFLAENGLVTFYLHPLLRIGPPDRDGPARWNEILEATKPFQQQAYEQQSEARLSILPILEPEADADWIRAAEFFLAASAKPSVLLRGPAALERAREAAGREIRFYIEPDPRSGADGLLRQLWINSVFEDLLERVKAAAEGASLLLPCRTHRVVDQRRNEVYACFRDWSIGRPLGTLERISEDGSRITGSCKGDACAACISRALCSMTENLIANDSQAEGRRVHLQLAMAFSDGGRHREAIEHATRARDLASLDAERADASTIEGLCHLGLREFEQAERALAEAAGSSDDPGLVAFHRGRVQFEWRDYIEALERFEEALASGSEAVPEVDLLYYMAVSHVHIQEYPEARSYLGRWEQTGERRALMLYYRALCNIGEESFEAALSELRECEEAGPDRQDMDNVLFYTGVCLKELGRYEEAIPVLERAAEFDAGENAVFNLLGFCHFKTAGHARAVECFTRAIELDPRSAIDHANLAVNLEKLGRVEEAIPLYRKALSLDPHIGFARNNLRRLTGEPDRRG
jgi:tetratricopeptide (TPR) repeat protein